MVERGGCVTCVSLCERVCSCVYIVYSFVYSGRGKGSVRQSVLVLSVSRRVRLCKCRWK